MLTRTTVGIAGVAVDILLGVQLLRLRHSWRLWTMIRAAIGVVVGLPMVFGRLPGSDGLAGVAVGAGQIAYCASLLLLLFARPTLERVRLGRVVFAASVVLVLGGSVLAAMRPETERVEVMGDARVVIAGPSRAMLTPTDLSSIRSLMRQPLKPWLVIGQWPEQARPTQWPVVVFFEPSATTPELRRGEATTLFGTLRTRDHFRGWEVFPVPMRYAQAAVASGAGFLTNGADAAAPFITMPTPAGELADHDIVSIVGLLRTSPRASGGAVNGTWPIGDMSLIAPGRVQVVLSDPTARSRSGQQVVIQFVDRGWTVVEISPWAI